MPQINVSKIMIGDKNPLVLIAGPCVIESEKTCMETAERIKEITQRLEIPFIFKSSFDKANRSSIDSYRGPGLEKGLEILNKVKQKLNVPVLSDIHSEDQAQEAAKVLDVIHARKIWQKVFA